MNRFADVFRSTARPREFVRRWVATVVKVGALVSMFILAGCGHVTERGFLSRLDRLLEISSALEGVSLGDDDETEKPTDADDEAKPAAAVEQAATSGATTSETTTGTTTQ